MSTHSSQFGNLPPLQRAYLALEEMQLQVDALERARTEPIAIVGIGCRFPGGADSPDRYWRLLAEGVDAVAEVPPARWDVNAVYDPDPARPGKTYSRWGSFIDAVDQFDPYFFGISPREAALMDPQQRLLLEVAWEALEHAGLPADSLAGSRTGVFVGLYNNDYAHLQNEDDIYSAIGSSLGVASGRLSYVFDFHGPSMLVDTLCSSSLVAVHLACQSLRRQECGLALAGGVNLILTPLGTILSSRLMALAPDGRCKTFDARANGYVRGEGCGVVVLKRLRDAVADGDHIWALIRGSAVNQDGRSTGLTAPNMLAQQAVIRQALEDGQVSPEAVGFVEAHGTGTPLGDPIEMEALKAVYGHSRPSGQTCAVGSVKTNLGHLEAAAGIAGLIKTVLALHHRAIPPHLHLRQLNPRIDLRDTSLQIPTTLQPWAAAGESRYAAVSAFGLSGTNAHIVLEQAPAPADTPDRPADSGALSLLPLSARTPEALRALAERYAALLSEPQAPSLAEIAAAAGSGRSHFAQRAAVLAPEPAQALAAVTALAHGHSHPALQTGQAPTTAASPRIVFVCAGQGGQWPGMAQALLADPVAAAVLKQVAQAAPADLGWDLLAVLADPAAPWLERIDQLQPLLFAVQVALAARLQAWGITPAAVVGHSFGEVAAAYLAGALSLPDALWVICARSRALAQRRGQGAMAVVELDEAAATALLAARDEAGVTVAGVNGPRSTVLAGEPAGLARLVADLTGQGVFARPLAVDVAAHSPQLDGLVAGLAAELSDVSSQAGRLPFYSTVTGRVQAGAGLDGGYWARNLRAPVRFWEAVQALVADGYVLFVELGPHPTLTHALADGLRALGVSGQALAALRRDEPMGETLRQLLGALYCVGAPVAWAALAPGRRAAAALPTYPFQRERYWIETASPASAPALGLLPARAHPLLGVEQALATQVGTTLWTRTLTAASLPELPDHQVDGMVVLPGAVLVEMLLAAGRARVADARLTGITFSHLLALPAGSVLEVQTVLAEAGAGAQVQVLSRMVADQAGPWTRHAQGAVQPADAARLAPLPLAEIRARCDEAISAADYYELLAGQGLAYGPAFRRLAALWRRDGEVLAELSMAAEPAVSGPPYHVPPTLLDACFQALGAALPLDQSDRHGAPALPIGVEDLRLRADPAAGVWAYARLNTENPPDASTLTGDVFLLGAGGEVIVEARGFRVQRLDPPARPAVQGNDWLYELVWERQSGVVPTNEAQDEPGSWLIFASRDSLSRDLVGQLAAHGQRGVVVSPGDRYAQHTPDRFGLDQLDAASYQRLLREALPAHAPPCRGVVYLWGLDLEPDIAQASPTEAALPACAGLLHLAQALARAGWRDAPRLWLVTRGAQSVAAPEAVVAVGQAPLWGLARTIAIEQPELACTCIDLDPAGSAGAGDLWEAISAADAEAQVALRQSARYVARLAHRDTAVSSAPTEMRAPAQDRAFRLELATPGILDGLRLREMQRRAPGPGEVEIAVEAAGLNFLDVLGALGARPDQTDGPLALGGECAGIVTRVGVGVTDVAIGDTVVALAASSFATHVTTSALLVVPKPAPLSFAEAASLPVVFLTAYYALCELGRLQPGERVLIHSAAGGTGLAALQLAQRAGAQVFATAGSPARREFLQTLGVAAVADSRSLAFADQFRADSGGRGMDVVLNALTGPAMEQSLALLAPYGRFLEIAKKEIYANTHIGLEPFRKNLSYFAIDLARMIVERPEYVRRMLVEIMRRFAAGELRPLPLTPYPIAQVGDAFHAMAQARHIGKLVLTFEERTTTPIAPAPAAGRALVRSDGAYLITGGLGGIGLTLAAWLVRQGAQHLVLAGRRPPTPAAEAALADLRATGATVQTAQLNVADRPALAALLQQFGASRPPLRGLIHAAAVLDDATLLNLDVQRLSKVLAPKLDGAWHLHTLTRDIPLDFFVLFSSAAGLLGSPGQANYAAANAFLDALAHHRRALGLPAISINWGPWAEVGLAAAQANRGQRLAVQGLAGLSPTEGLAALEFLLSQPVTQVAVMKFNLRHWGQLFPRAAGAPLLARLRDADAAAPERDPGRANHAVREALLAVAPGLRLSGLEAHLIEQIALVLRLPLDQIDADSPLPTLGLDSLMALELRNRLELSLGVTLSATLIWSYPTVAALAPFMAEKMGIALAEAGPATAARAATDPSGPANPTSGLADLSEEAAALLLAEKLTDIDRDYFDDEPPTR